MTVLYYFLQKISIGLQSDNVNMLITTVYPVNIPSKVHVVNTQNFNTVHY